MIYYGEPLSVLLTQMFLNSTICLVSLDTDIHIWMFYTTQSQLEVFTKHYKQILLNVYSKIEDNKSKTFRTLTYLGTITECVAKQFKKKNINIAFTTNNSLGPIVKNNKLNCNSFENI